MMKTRKALQWPIMAKQYSSVYYRVDEKYASAPVYYKTITFWETPFMNSNFDSCQK